MLPVEVKQDAREIHRRRTKALGSAAPPFRRTLMEMYFLYKYAQRPYTFDDIRQDSVRGLVFNPKDRQGMSFEIVGHHYEDPDFRVYEYQMENDIIVFWDYNKDDDYDFVIAGYLPLSFIEECPVSWVVNEKNERVSYYHTVHESFLFPMPENFTFSLEPRPHTCKTALYWCHEARAWRCLQCTVAFPSAKERMKIEGEPSAT